MEPSTSKRKKKRVTSTTGLRRSKVNRNKISKCSIKRLARRGGVKRIAEKVYKVAAELLEAYLKRLVGGCFAYAEYFKRKTIKAEDVVRTMKSFGQRLYGFDEPIMKETDRNSSQISNTESLTAESTAETESTEYNSDSDATVWNEDNTDGRELNARLVSNSAKKTDRGMMMDSSEYSTTLYESSTTTFDSEKNREINREVEHSKNINGNINATPSSKKARITDSESNAGHSEKFVSSVQNNENVSEIRNSRVSFWNKMDRKKSNYVEKDEQNKERMTHYSESIAEYIKTKEFQNREVLSKIIFESESNIENEGTLDEHLMKKNEHIPATLNAENSTKSDRVTFIPRKSLENEDGMFENLTRMEENIFPASCSKNYQMPLWTIHGSKSNAIKGQIKNRNSTLNTDKVPTIQNELNEGKRKIHGPGSINDRQNKIENFTKSSECMPVLQSQGSVVNSGWIASDLNSNAEKAEKACRNSRWDKENIPEVRISETNNGNSEIRQNLEMDEKNMDIKQDAVTLNSKSQEAVQISEISDEMHFENLQDTGNVRETVTPSEDNNKNSSSLEIIIPENHCKNVPLITLDDSE